MDECVGGADQVFVGVGIECVARDDFRTAGEIAFRSRAHQSADMVAALEEHGDQVAAEVTGSSRNKHTAGVIALRELFDSQQETDVRN
jgi:hypothetical protein